MAIKSKEEKSVPQIPSKLQGLLTKAFGEQFLSDKFDKKFKETKVEIEDFLKAGEFDITKGTATPCAEGTFNYVERNTVTVDKDALIEMVESGAVSLAQVLACVSTFKNEELEKAISTSKFKEISSVKTTASLTLKGSAEYKAKMEADFEGGFSLPEEKTEVKEEPKLLDTSKLKAKKKAVKKVEAENVDDDLDSILKG
jgi:hypothetical protein